MSAVVDPMAFVPPALRALAPYRLDLSPCRFKLDQNEVPWPLPRRLREAALAELVEEPWERYPDFHAEALRAALGERHDWPAAGVLVGNGSNELLALALAALAGERELLGLAPSFGLYPVFALAARARLVAFGPRPDLRLAFDELLAAVEADPRRPVLLCSPNNPTGEALPVTAVARLLERLEAPLLLDNAYGEFCDHDYRPLLAHHRHLLIFRTFSKAWSLAGWRLGYLIADPALVAELIKLKLPYNLNRGSAAVGRFFLARPRLAGRRIALLRERRAAWSAALAAAGAEVVPSQANFVLARFSPERARVVRDELAARGLRVRDVAGYPGLEGCLRVSIGSAAALRALRGALSQLGDETGEAAAAEPGE